MAQTLSDVVDLLVEGQGDAVTVEGAADVVDYEVLDGGGRPVAVRQAKARQEPGTWGASELARILCAWGKVDYADATEFAFVTDASLNDSGQRLQDLLTEMQIRPDEEVLRRTAAKLGRGGVELPSLDVLRRVQILTRMGTAEAVLDRVEMRILTLLGRARLAAPEDSANATNALLRRLFVVGGSIDLKRRTISRAQVLDALGLDEASLQGDLAWSRETAAAYCAAVADESRQAPLIVPVDVMPAASAPGVLRLMRNLDRGSSPQQLDAVLEEQCAALVGATGEGKSAALRYLAGAAARRGLVPVRFDAAGHVAGMLPRRVRHAIEAVTKRPLTAGAVQHVLAAPELLLLIDGVAEVSAGTREGLSADLSQLSAQRPVRVIAAGRDLPLTLAGAALPEGVAAFRMAKLGHSGREELAAAHGGPQAVRAIEHRLGDAVDNPMLFLMALTLYGDGIPPTRAEAYEQFVRGLTARAGVPGEDIGLAALGVAWARMIGRNQRAAGYYGWRVALGAALDELAAVPAWRGHAGTAETAIEAAQRTGLLVLSDPDSGLEPLHDSFADFLAARAIARREVSLPGRLNTGYDEAVMFVVEIAGLDEGLALRLATENPLLSCRVAQQRRACDPADAAQVGLLLHALTGGRELPLLTGAGIRLCNHERFTGVALAGQGCREVDDTTFTRLAREHPAVTMPARTDSLQLAVMLWAVAIERTQRPGRRLSQPAPPADAGQAAPLLAAYLRETEQELHRLAGVSLPDSIRDRVLAAIGPRGVTAYVGDPVTGQLGGLDIPVRYQPSAGYAVTRGQPPPGLGPYGSGTAAGMMRLHPVLQAAREIRQALSALTNYTWPVVS
jgi:hypothetical protein